VGEGALLGEAERRELWERVRAAVPRLSLEEPKPRTLLAFIDTPGVREAARQAAEAAAAGFDAVVAVAPHEDAFARRSPDRAQLFFRALADQSPVPVIAADLPEVTGFTVPALGAASAHPRIAAVLDGSGERDRAKRLIEAGCKVLCGSERAALASLRAGASGTVLPVATAAPYGAIALWEAFRTREEEAALDWQNRLEIAAALIEREYGVAGWKAAMDINGYYGGPPRLPGAPVSPEARKRIAQAFLDLRS
jgi:4-hydroxy-2-oxoglutarate aldolase